MRLYNVRGNTLEAQFDGKRLVVGPEPSEFSEEEARFLLNGRGSELAEEVPGSSNHDSGSLDEGSVYFCQECQHEHKNGSRIFDAHRELAKA